MNSWRDYVDWWTVTASLALASSWLALAYEGARIGYNHWSVFAVALIVAWEGLLLSFLVGFIRSRGEAVRRARAFMPRSEWWADEP